MNAMKVLVTETCDACKGVGELRNLGYPSICKKCEGKGKTRCLEIMDTSKESLPPLRAQYISGR